MVIALWTRPLAMTGRLAPVFRWLLLFVIASVGCTPGFQVYSGEARPADETARVELGKDVQLISIRQAKATLPIPDRPGSALLLLPGDYTFEFGTALSMTGNGTEGRQRWQLDARLSAGRHYKTAASWGFVGAEVDGAGNINADALILVSVELKDEATSEVVGTGIRLREGS